METREIVAIAALVVQSIASIVSLFIAIAARKSAQLAERTTTLAEQNTRFGALNSLLDVLIQLRMSRKDDPSFARQNPSEIQSVRSFHGLANSDQVTDEHIKAYLYYAVTIGFMEKQYLAIQSGTLGKEHVPQFEGHVRKLMTEPLMAALLDKGEESTIFLYTPLLKEMREYFVRRAANSFESKSLRSAVGLPLTVDLAKLNAPSS